MTTLRMLTLSISFLLPAAACFGQQKPSQIASAFLPPRTQIVTLNRFDPTTGKLIGSLPAVLTGHFLSQTSNDIVFAYVNEAKDPQVASVFVTMLHELSDGYAKVFEMTYCGRSLWVQDFATVGLKVFRLPGRSTDSVVIATARGASLGFQTEVYNWVDGFGLVNVMPTHPSAHHLSFTLENNQFLLELSFEKYPGEKGIPRPVVYRWDGHQLTPSV